MLEDICTDAQDCLDARTAKAAFHPRAISKQSPTHWDTYQPPEIFSVRSSPLHQPAATAEHPSTAIPSTPTCNGTYMAYPLARPTALECSFAMFQPFAAHSVSVAASPP
jgi:hypothetical protein